jgi:hypothetical protein
MNRVLNLAVKYKNKEDEDLILDIVHKKKRKGSLTEVKDTLNKWGVDYEIKNQNHIKVGNINYYVSTGSIYIDGLGGKFKKKGLTFLKQILEKSRLI